MSRALVLLGLVCWPAAAQTRDPAAWGANHLGKPVPEYMHGDECLFCHRNDIGPGWAANRHGITVRQREDAPALAAKAPAEVEYFLTSRDRVRFLKKAGYGKFALFDAARAAWDAERFGAGCAGCHSTGVDPKTRAFAAFGLDCYVCHGVVPPEHSSDTSLAWLSKKRRGDALAVTSICAQCHLRGGQSRSTGLAYANTFVAGDNLFQDFSADWARAADPALNAGDRHVWRNVRDVVLLGREQTTCLSCHRIHAQSSAPHRRVLRSELCLDCHQEKGPLKTTKTYQVRSAVCEY